ncbi:MAG: O-antigen ligase family protein [Verrucomicrobia subdivision 3 bacterium]|nr:O-antigen ligase family protein [Limisphaerales bacterium]
MNLWRDAPMPAGLALYAIGALAYALRYDQASKSTDALLLCFGLTVFLGFRFWHAVEAKRSEPFNIAGVIVAFTLVLLSISAVWRPESFQNFQYRGQARWSGLWANPNTFGILMGVGVVLAIGQAVLRLKLKVQSRSTSEPGLRSAEWWHWVKIVSLLTAAGLCGLGLVKSYSRGAWLGTAVGLAFLLWNLIKTTAHRTGNSHPQRLSHPMGEGGVGLSPLSQEHLIRPSATFSPSDAEKGARGGEGESLSCSSYVSRLKKNWLPTSVILASVFVLAFWNFRHTDRLVARRAFSVGNVNDFSWRNRVAAYQGSLQMMAEKPWLGFGWNQPGQVYDEFYRTPKVAEGAAIQMNDYFTLGTTLGVPALLCLVAFIGLTLGRGSRVEGRAPVEPQPSAFSLQPSGFCLPSVCRAGAIVLLVGFWFDGGLFKLATGAMFWILLALGKEDDE